MILSFCFCFLCGFGLGTRYRIYALVPASAAAVLLAVSVAFASGASLLGGLGLVVLLPSAVQAGYASALIFHIRFAAAGGIGVHGS